ncbi:ATP-binding protein [Actinomadura viridis]|uniref:ATP-binding protein n=1 Tax=Actinomadura viridis TaxID=58110 RepID=UPI0036B93384
MTTSLIGRDHPAAVLDAEIDRAISSHGGLVLVTGDAGIGKTALVTTAAQRARRAGAAVLGGSCWDSAAAPGHWPWTQVIRALRRAAGPQEWAGLQEMAGEELAALLGEAPGTGADGFRLYDAVTTALVAASQARPVVVVLDDLHWADAASIRLLEFAARHTWFERLLLVGTYRDVEVEAAGHPLRPSLGALAAKATVVTLTGLGRAEVGRLMRRTVGREPDDELIGEVHRRTGGNPFFVEQTARLWHGGGSVTAIAPGVRDAVQRRLSLLPPAVAAMLTPAAVLGREFHRGVLAATAEIPVPHADRLLDQAVAARLVTSLGGGRFAFAHDLVRETLYGALDEAAARDAHAAVVRALDRSPALADRVLPAEAARHAHLAGDRVDPDRVVELLTAAADHASSLLSFEEAAGHLRRALEHVPADRIRERTLLTMELAGALHRGDHHAAWDVLEEAVALARSADDDELFARVALTLFRHCQFEPAEGRRRLDLLEEAHRKLVGGPAPDPGPFPHVRMAQELAAKVAGQAREDGDDKALIFGLWARHDAMLGMGTASEREALTTELAALAQRSGDRAAAAFATSFGWVALLEQGDPRYLDRHRAFLEMTEREKTTTWRLASLVDQAIVNTVHGHFAEAEPQIRTIVDAQESDQDFGGMAVHLRWALEILRGGFEAIHELGPAIREQGRTYATLVEGLTAVQRGDTSTALRHLAAAEETAGPLEGTMEPLRLRLLAQAAAASGDPGLCERARAELLPFRDQWAVALHGCDVGGPMSLWLGAVDAAEGRWDGAVALLTDAYRSADLLLARPWSVEARARLGEVLASRGRPGDRAKAAELLSGVAGEAREMGMRHLADRARAALASLDGPAGPNGPAGAAGAGGASRSGGDGSGGAGVSRGVSGRAFRFDGQVWTLAFGDRTVHMPDAKGLRDLRLLLGSPGTPIPAGALLAPEGGEIVAASLRPGGDPVLDEEAKAAYRRRLGLLDEEIDRAAALGDDRRAAEYDRERAALLEELRAAAGLAGRTRRLGDESERARKAVTARIRDTLRKLDGLHPELAGHLRATVSTGATCVYRPADDTPWRL